MTGVDEGGSTITEQLAKVIYTGGRTGITDRVAQVALALKLDGHFTKAAVLSMYLSAIYFGHGYYGVLAASEGYFGRLPDQLSWAQASLLAGLPQAPSLLDPLQHLAAARAPPVLRPRPPGRDRGADPGGGGCRRGRAPRPALTRRWAGRLGSIGAGGTEGGGLATARRSRRRGGRGNRVVRPPCPVPGA